MVNSPTNQDGIPLVLTNRHIGSRLLVPLVIRRIAPGGHLHAGVTGKPQKPDLAVVVPKMGCPGKWKHGLKPAVQFLVD